MIQFCESNIAVSHFGYIVVQQRYCKFLLLTVSYLYKYGVLTRLKNTSSLTLTLTHTCSLTLTHTLNHSLMHPPTHTHTLTHTYTHAHTHTHTQHHPTTPHSTPLYSTPPSNWSFSDVFHKVDRKKYICLFAVLLPTHHLALPKNLFAILRKRWLFFSKS